MLTKVINNKHLTLEMVEDVVICSLFRDMPCGCICYVDEWH